MTCYSSLYNQLELGNVFPQAKIQVQWSEIHAFTAQCLSSIPGRGTNIPQASQYSHTHKKKKIRKTRRTVSVQKMERWKSPGFPSGSLCFWSILWKEPEWDPLTWGQACSRRAWRSRCDRSPQSQNLRGLTPLRGHLHPSRLWALETYTSHTLVYTSSHLSRIPIPSPFVAAVHTLESMDLDVCSTLLVTLAQTSYLASLWVSVSLRASKRAECGAWCARVVGGRGGEGTQAWGSGLASLMKGKMLEFSLRGGFFKFEHSIFCLPGEGNLAGWLGDRVSQRKSGRGPPGQTSQEERRKLARPRTALLSPSKGRQSSRKIQEGARRGAVNRRPLPAKTHTSLGKNFRAQTLELTVHAGFIRSIILSAIVYTWNFTQ